jgi:hypothetical protein
MAGILAGGATTGAATLPNAETPTPTRGATAGGAPATAPAGATLVPHPAVRLIVQLPVGTICSQRQVSTTILGGAPMLYIGAPVVPVAAPPCAMTCPA